MKRFISMLLTAVMMLSLISMSMFSVSAGTLTDEQGVVYTLSDDEAYYIVSSYTGTVTEVVIPSTYNGLPVKRIGDEAFAYCENLSSITIPDSVTSIGEKTFYWCSSLTSITIPDSLTSIGWYAFAHCKNLSSITIPDSVTRISYSAFYYCSSLTSITIPDSVTSIGGNAFEGCSSIESITVASGNTVYHSSGNCLIETATKTLITGCKNSIIPSDGSVTGIGDMAFFDCENLSSITIPNSVISIGDETFAYCENLSSITIPDSVISIGYETFAYCENLSSITIPDSVTSIGEKAFIGCSSLESITVAAGNTVYKSSGNCIIEIAAKTLIAGCKNSVIPSDGSVTCIGNGAFFYCESLTSITIPNSVTSIGHSAFYFCTGLTSIAIPNSITSVGWYAFWCCTSLTDIYCEAESQPDGWNEDWNIYCNATVHWGYTSEVAADDLESGISEIEAKLIESDYAKEEWTAIQAAIASAKDYDTEGKTAGEIRTEIAALEKAILLNPKKSEFGDVDGKNGIGSIDYLLAKRSCFNTYSMSEVELSRADLDRSGEVDSTDYLLIKRIAFGTYKVI